MLSPNTSYTFEITDRVKDQEGVPFESTSFRFETGEMAYRKLITMNRPFGERPEVGEWEEKDVSGENLSAPFLRKATPKPVAPKVEEPPKLLKPERSRDELLALVLRFYGGPKLPPGFGPTVLEAPKAVPLPLAELREVPFDFEALMAMSAPHPDDEFDERWNTPVISENPATPTPAVTEAETQPQASISPEIDLKMQILEKWIMASLVDVSFENEPASIGAPRFQTPRQLVRRKAPISEASVGQLLATVNQELIEEEKQAQLAIDARATREAEMAAQLAANREAAIEAKQALAQKTATQEKWSGVVWDEIAIEIPAYVFQAKSSFLPGKLSLRKSSISQVDVEQLLAVVNQELIEEEKQAQLALDARATREAEMAAQQVAEKEAAQEKPAKTAAIAAVNPTPPKPQETSRNPKPETSLNTASLLVEETIKNADRAGKIVFPQTAIFVNEYVTVEFDLPQREFVSFVLRDIKGDVYRTEGGYVEAGPHKRAVTLEDVPAGAYEAVVETIHQKVVRKITILN